MKIKIIEKSTNINKAEFFNISNVIIETDEFSHTMYVTLKDGSQKDYNVPLSFDIIINEEEKGRK